MKKNHTGLQVTYRNNDDIPQLVRRAAVLPLVPMYLIEDLWFNALYDLEDMTFQQTQLHSRTMLQPNGSTVTDKYGTTSTQMDPVPQITSRVGTTN